MFIVNINGKDYESAQDKKLLRFLRDDLHLTATKDGCSEGACGTCTVLVDGAKVKACIPTLSKLAGKKVLTVEGIPAEEMKVYEHCFAVAGAVQCGFCIPGMIISAKSLLDTNLNPTRDEVQKAICAVVRVIKKSKMPSCSPPTTSARIAPSSPRPRRCT